MGIALNLSCLSVESGGALQLSSTIQLGMPFWGLSIALNVIATGLIAFKLFQHRRFLVAAGVTSESRLAPISAILIESAAFYSVAGLIFIPFQLIDSPYVTPVSMLFTSASFLSPALIQLRISQGVAYTRKDSRTTLANSSVGPLKFSSQASGTIVDFNPPSSEKQGSLVRYHVYSLNCH
jgi:hypothetical protein